MKINRIICLVLCIAMVLCCAACRKNDVEHSDTSSLTSVITETEIIDNSSSQPQTIVSIPSIEDNVSNEIIYDDTQSEEENIYKFNFNTIDTVNYFCVKNIPNSDVIYAVTEIIADTKDDISIGCKLFCDDSNVKINNKTITIPRHK